MGWLTLPIASDFFVTVRPLVALASLYTYGAGGLSESSRKRDMTKMHIEVRPDKRPQVIAGKYCQLYYFEALVSGIAIPVIDAIGVGPSSIMSRFSYLAQRALLAISRRNPRSCCCWPYPLHRQTRRRYATLHIRASKAVEDEVTVL